MQRNILEYLEDTVQKYPQKTAFANDKMGMTFQEVYQVSRSIGTCLHEKGYEKEPVVIYMHKHPHMIAAFWGVVYSSCFYVPIDEEMPKFRIELIFQNLKPRAVICDEATSGQIREFEDFTGEVLLYDEIAGYPVNDQALSDIRRKAIDTDPIYIVFTSGSTGIPKGVVACHRSVIDYVESLTEVLGVNEDSVLANQTPLYFDACLKELFSSLKCGATTYLVPKALFMFPIKLVEFLNEYKINTVCWVVSALTMISSMKTFDKVVPKYLHTVAFGSEVFPIKQFNLWRKALPNARFINLYGPTEITCNCTYHPVQKVPGEGEKLPIGRAFPGRRVFLLSEEGGEIREPEQTGEICVAGESLSLGYYHDPQETEKSFQERISPEGKRERYYKTGDMGYLGKDGNLYFSGRRDFQIKFNGHRIELEEMERVLDRMPGIEKSCCVTDQRKTCLAAFYMGEADPGEIRLWMKKRLPGYMVPRKIFQTERLPLTKNGKTDRGALQKRLEGRR